MQHTNLDEEHKCFAAKCPGVRCDAPEKYGRWAYWRKGPKGWGWYAEPSRRWVREGRK